MAKTKIKANNRAQGNVRIIAGQWRGRKLPVMLADGLRPTTDRVKETLFNWLMPHIHNANCLDCFAGSGSLGLEALSRGAGQCTFIELNPAASKQITLNLSTLKADNGQVINQDALNYLSGGNTQAYDLVFIDPPFRKNLLADTCELLENNGQLSEDALIYIEVERELQTLQLPLNWQLIKEKIAGQVAYRLYQRC
jgi:16S rRNA (guanine966-N2)-methyltransferase